MKKSELFCVDCHVYFICSLQQIYTSALETGIFTFQLFKKTTTKIHEKLLLYEPVIVESKTVLPYLEEGCVIAV